MKDPLNKDNIDELLQNSLERYEEMPSDAVWTGIERDLGKSPRRRRFVLFWALGLLLLTSGVAVFYFKTKPPEKSVPQIVFNENKEKAIDSPTARPDEFSARSTATENPAHEQAGMQSDKSGESSSGRFYTPLTAVLYKADPNKQSSIINASSDLYDVETTGTRTTRIKRIFTDFLHSQSAFIRPIRVIRVPVVIAPDRLLPLKARPLPEISSLPSGPEKRSPRLYAGAGFMPLILWQSVEAMRQRPVRPGTLPVAITAEAESPSLGYAWGIDLGIAANDRWSFWSGAHIRNLQTRTAHQAKMRRADGQWPGGNDTELRFRYMLNTPAGGVAVDVRMEQVDTTLNLPPAEPVSFELQTTQTMQYLSVPLLVKYHDGRGRWRFVASGGLSANFLMSNTLEIDRFASRSLRFRPSRFIRPLAGNEYLRTFSLDFRIGAGVRYQINRSVGLSFEPVYFGQLTGASNDPYLQTSSRSLGLNAAVWYKF